MKKTIRKILWASIVGVSALALQSCYLVQPQKRLAQGKQNFQQHNYRRAFRDLKPLAREGNPDAQYALGYMYFYGKGILENHHAAKYWMEQAAKQGQPLAQNALKVLQQQSQDFSDTDHV